MIRIYKKQKHKAAISDYVSKLHWDTINTVLDAQKAGKWTKKTEVHLNNNAKLIKKYQRRLSLLRF